MASPSPPEVGPSPRSSLYCRDWQLLVVISVTPIPRPSHYHGWRHQGSMTEPLRRDQADATKDNSVAPLLAPAVPAAQFALDLEMIV